LRAHADDGAGFTRKTLKDLVRESQRQAQAALSEASSGSGSGGSDASAARFPVGSWPGVRLDEFALALPPDPALIAEQKAAAEAEAAKAAASESTLLLLAAAVMVSHGLLCCLQRKELAKAALRLRPRPLTLLLLAPPRVPMQLLVLAPLVLLPRVPAAATALLARARTQPARTKTRRQLLPRRALLRPACGLRRCRATGFLSTGPSSPLATTPTGESTRCLSLAA
jgi:hypothetical protein